MAILGDVVAAPVRYGYKAYQEWQNPLLLKRVFKSTRSEHGTQLSTRSQSVFSGSLLPNNDVAPFLRLPFELRRQIYSDIFVDRWVIYLEAKPRGRMGLRLTQSHVLYSACSETHNRVRSSPTDWMRRYLEWRLLPRGCVVMCGPDKLIEGLDKPLDIGLLRTCRQIYQEGTPLLYGTNTFDIADPGHLIYLYRNVPSSCLVNVRYLQLKTPELPKYVWRNRGIYGTSNKSTWLDAWDIIANHMISLRELNLTLNLRYNSWEEEKFWLAPVGHVRGLTVFVLRVDYWGVEFAREERQELRKELSRKVKMPREKKHSMCCIEC